jgi:hypothetical protein
MPRKYGLGKYGAGTYDLEAVHEIILLEGSFTVPVTVTTAALTNIRRLMGFTIVKVNINGVVGHTARLEGMIAVSVDITNNKIFIGPQWEPDSNENWCDVIDPWIPVTIPNIPCKVPL